jgi:meiosis induction protein kinase IME2/SME1
MKKTFDSFQSCLELREVIFLRSLPPHPHLVPALDIFLDPYSRRLHIAMEYMDGNLYQLMKARDHKPMDAHSVKSILFQILSGLEHIHQREFFHRDIKPENILVSTSQQNDTSHPFRRYSALMTPPSTPPVYTIKIADFGLARETHSKLPYTTYVSTRWYRAPEVLLRAGSYSAPVDIWAVGAMAVEIATLKPLFPGGNEVDQVWRVCEIMGSPGSWVNKHGHRVGGGEWKDGVRLAQKLGFSFPKMAPHSLDTILQTPQWPASLATFVTSCLMWDPRGRPTSTQALAHEYFQDAFDPLRLKSSSSRLLGRKQSDISTKDSPDASPSLTSKTSSWLRRSLVARESAPAVPQHTSAQTASPRPSPAHASPAEAPTKQRPNPTKRATWTNGVPVNGAPIPILPSIRPVSPLSAEVTAQASVRAAEGDEKAAKKIGRQLSVASHGNHYADIHRQEAERALNGQSGLASPLNGQKEGFFSHLRKRARRLSGRYQTPMSPNSDDVEANAGCAPWASGNNRQSMLIDPPPAPTPSTNSDFSDLDKAMQNVRCSLEAPPQPSNVTKTARVAANPMLKRHHSLNHGPENRTSQPGVAPAAAPISSRTRRALQTKSNPSNNYETPNEEEELLSEVLASTHKAVKKLDGNSYAAHEQQRKVQRPAYVDGNPAASYLTPSPSANRNGVGFGQSPYMTPTKPLEITKTRAARDQGASAKYATPPDDPNDWASSVAASLLATQSMYR